MAQTNESDFEHFIRVLISFPASEQACLWVLEDGRVCGATLHPDVGLATMHFRNAHALRGDSKEKTTCPWQNCSSQPIQWRNVLRHILSMHLGLLRWTCPLCQKSLARKDMAHQCYPQDDGDSGGMSQDA